VTDPDGAVLIITDGPTGLLADRSAIVFTVEGTGGMLVVRNSRKLVREGVEGTGCIPRI
jgi:hypothetical protein